MVNSIGATVKRSKLLRKATARRSRKEPLRSAPPYVSTCYPPRRMLGRYRQYSGRCKAECASAGALKAGEQLMNRRRSRLAGYGSLGPVTSLEP
jgi:hypothetical protein